MRRPPRHRSGMSLVEVMLSLAISSMLLSAVGAALCASSSVVKENDEFFRATQAARVAMNQVLTEVRRSHAVSVNTGRVDVITYDQRDIGYVYDSTNKALKLATNSNTADPDYLLAENVTSCTFSADTKSDQGGIAHVVRVSVTLDVTVGRNHLKLTGSAAPRREVTYE